MAKPLEEQHLCDYRPRFKYRDHKKIQALADKWDVPPNVVVRTLAIKALREHDVEDHKTAA